MKLSIGTNYADFKAVVAEFYGLRTVFYGKSGAY